MRLLHYTPGNIPTSDPYEMARALEQELQGISRVLNAVQAGYRIVYHAEPSAPEQGMIAYADGTDWNPGSGEGHYEYDSSGTWVKL